MPSSKPILRFQDIVDNIDWIRADIGNKSQEEFLEDRKTTDAVLYSLLRISEASSKLGELAKQYCPDIPWLQIRQAGNHFRHSYSELDYDKIWNVIQNDLEPLRQAATNAIKTLSEKE